MTVDRHRIALHLHLQHAAFWWMLSTWETSCRFFSATGALSSRGLWPAGQSTTATSPRRDGNQTLHLVYCLPRRHPCLETTENQGACCVVCRNEGVGPLCEWSSGDHCLVALFSRFVICFWKFTGSWPVAVSQISFTALVPGTRRRYGFNTSNAASEMCRRNSFSHRFYLSSIWPPVTVLLSDLPHTIRSLQAFRSSMHTDTR